MTKICTKCKMEKSLQEYHKDKKGNCGRRSECKTCANESKKIYFIKNREKMLNKAKQDKQKYKQYYKEYNKIYFSDPTNKEKAKQYKIKSHKKSLLKPEYKIIRSLRRRMLFVLHGKRKADSSISLIGCTGEQLKLHLESQFQKGMTWDNYGHKGWHIDHIKPCSSFDLTDPEQQKVCFHYTNLQPLWALDNLIKSDKI